MSKNIILVGFMGAGKSVVAKRLSERQKKKLVSTDDMIIRKEGRSINDIFRDSGEPYFRRVEKEVVSEVGTQSDLVVDCGGGVILNEDNIRNLRENGIVIYLKATPQILYQRVKRCRHRPLLNVKNLRKTIEDMLNARCSFYEKSAHHVIETSHKTVDQVVEEIRKLVRL